jgi:peptidoglycan/xylan/chitin deacetylase (PgdA/CDA1 family)
MRHPLFSIPIALFLLASCIKTSSSPSSANDENGPSPVSTDPICADMAGKTPVSLTYDDAMPTQLKVAAPALEARGLLATFFIWDVRKDPAPWAELKKKGHELGAQTLNHPCPAFHSWVEPGKASEDYDLERMQKELDESVGLLASLGQERPHTFAYPCGVTWVGESKESYIPLVEERFVAARGVAPAVAGNRPNFSDVPTYFFKTNSADHVARLEEARAHKSWIVFGFHGIGGDWETLSTEAHEEVLDYLVQHRENLFIAPFGMVAACLGAE